MNQSQRIAAQLREVNTKPYGVVGPDGTFSRGKEMTCINCGWTGPGVEIAGPLADTCPGCGANLGMGGVGTNAGNDV